MLDRPYLNQAVQEIFGERFDAIRYLPDKRRLIVFLHPQATVELSELKKLGAMFGTEDVALWSDEDVSEGESWIEISVATPRSCAYQDES